MKKLLPWVLVVVAVSNFCIPQGFSAMSSPADMAGIPSNPEKPANSDPQQTVPQQNSDARAADSLSPGSPLAPSNDGPGPGNGDGDAARLRDGGNGGGNRAPGGDGQNDGIFDTNGEKQNNRGDDETTAEYNRRVEAAKPYMEKLQKWTDYLNAADQYLNTALAQRNGINQYAVRASDFNAALGALLGAIGNAPANPDPALPRITQAELTKWLNDKAAAWAEYQPAMASAKNRVYNLITYLRNEKTKAENAIADAEQAIQQIMETGSTGISVGTPDKDALDEKFNDEEEIIREKFTKAQEAFEKIKSLAATIIAKVRMIIMAYEARGIQLTSAQRAVKRKLADLERLV